MYSAYKLNRQGDNIQPWRTLFPIWNHSVVPCPLLTVASWPAHRFLRRQVRWSGILISFRIFHSLLWSTQSKARSFTFIFPSMIYMIQMYVRNVWRQEFEYWNKTSKKTKNMGLPKFSSSAPTPRKATGAFHTQRAKPHFSVCPQVGPQASSALSHQVSDQLHRLFLYIHIPQQFPFSCPFNSTMTPIGFLFLLPII